MEQVAVQTVLPNIQLTQAGWCNNMNHETVPISRQIPLTWWQAALSVGVKLLNSSIKLMQQWFSEVLNLLLIIKRKRFLSCKQLSQQAVLTTTFGNYCQIWQHYTAVYRANGVTANCSITKVTHQSSVTHITSELCMSHDCTMLGQQVHKLTRQQHSELFCMFNLYMLNTNTPILCPFAGWVN